jgi:hypothetical protein
MYFHRSRKTRRRWESISKMINQWVETKSTRGDYDSAFVSPFLTKFLTEKNIRHLFTPQVFTNRNRVVDRVILTIRDMFYNLGPTPLCSTTAWCRKSSTRTTTRSTRHCSTIQQGSPLELYKKMKLHNPLIVITFLFCIESCCDLIISNCFSCSIQK